MHALHSLFKFFQPFFSLASTDYLPDTGSKDIHCSNRLFTWLATIIQPHVKCLDGCRIICNDHWLFKMLFYQVSFMFTLHIYSPFHIILEFLFLVCRAL